MNGPQPDNPSPHGPDRPSAPADGSSSERVEHWLEALRDRAEGLRGACTHSEAQYVLTLTGRLADATVDVPDDQVVHIGKHLEHMALTDEADVSAIHEQIEDLISLCRRMAGG